MKNYNSYFPHDSNAKDDPKCVLLIEQLGMEGYGIYWMLVETLREQSDYRYPLILIPALARRYNTTSEKVKAVICSYNLFGIENDEFFFSDSLIDRMKPLEEKRMIASNAGKASALKRKSNESSTDVQQAFNGRSTDVQRTFNEGSTSKVNKSKVNKSKEEDNKEDSKESKKGADKPSRFIPPTVLEVQKYISDNSYSVNASTFIDFYISKGWMVGKNKMKDWKAAVRTWQINNKQQKPEDIGVVLNNNTSDKYANDKLW